MNGVGEQGAAGSPRSDASHSSAPGQAVGLRRHLILAAYGTGLANNRMVLAPGDSLTVGRTSLAQLAIAGDAELSNVHFRLAWDGERALLTDLESARGTFFNGSNVTSVEIKNHGWFRAGNTDFGVTLEGETPPRDRGRPLAPPGQRRAALAELTQLASQTSLFAVVDPARTDRILTMMDESVDEYQCLYEGLTAETMSDVAPYLVALRADSRLLPRFVEEGWGDAWAIYLTSKARIKDVRAHLRTLLFVEEEEGVEPLYFRFYDPRVLSAFAPVLTVRQEELVFGPITSFYCEDMVGELLSFGRKVEGSRP